MTGKAFGFVRNAFLKAALAGGPRWARSRPWAWMRTSFSVSVKRDAGRRKPWIAGGAARSEAHRPDNGAPPDSMRITAAGTGLPDWTGAVSNNWAAVA